MDLAKLRWRGVRSLDLQCLNPKCRHRTLLNVDSYPSETLVQSFGPKMVCTKCGFIGADARPNWNDATVLPSKT
jgi:hypothetical protein